MSSREAPSIDELRAQAVYADIPHLYINGFANNLSNADVTLILEHNSRPVATVNMSYTVAKTLSVKLGTMIAHLEAVTGRPMLTTDEIGKYVEEAMAKESEGEKE